MGNFFLTFDNFEMGQYCFVNHFHDRKFFWKVLNHDSFEGGKEEA